MVVGGLLTEHFVQAPDHPAAARSALQLEQAEEDAEPDEQDQHEQAARDEAHGRAEDHLEQVAHACSSSPDWPTPFQIGTVYCTRRRLTSSIAWRSGFFGAGIPGSTS